MLSSSSSERCDNTNTVVGRFRYAKGCILYESEELQLAAQHAITSMATSSTVANSSSASWSPEYAAARERRDGHRFHLTVVTQHRSGNVDHAVMLALKSLEEEVQPHSPRLLDLGLGHCCYNDNESYYKVIC